MKYSLILFTVITLVFAQTESEPDFASTEQFTKKSYFNFGKKFYVEMIIGMSMALPSSWFKLYFPIKCGKAISIILNDTAEAVFYWRELSMLKEGWLVVDRDQDFDTYTVNRNFLYFLADNISIVFNIPRLVNSCGFKDGSGFIQQIETILVFVDEDVMQIVKGLMYADTGI